MLSSTVWRKHFQKNSEKIYRSKKLLTEHQIYSFICWIVCSIEYMFGCIWSLIRVSCNCNLLLFFLAISIVGRILGQKYILYYIVSKYKNTNSISFFYNALATFSKTLSVVDFFVLPLSPFILVPKGHTIVTQPEGNPYISKFIHLI